MSSLRQLGNGLFYAAVSVVLVVGGLSLALVEAGTLAPPPTAKPSPTLLLPSVTATMTVTEVSPTAPIVYSATPMVIVQTATPVSLTATTYVRTAAGSTLPSYPTSVACGPYAGWIRGYTVQSGDTLFHISTLYRTSVGALQTANCKTGTMIFTGERLWVPNVPTITPGITLIPTFPTSTLVPSSTPVPSETPTPFVPSYYTETAVPTETETETPNPDP